LFLDEERLLDEDEVALLPELLFDLDTPDEDRVEDPELLTADDPPDRLEDDLPTLEEREDLLPAADCNADDAALPSPRRIALPAEFDFERVSVIRDIVRAGDEVGRKFPISIRSAEGGVMLLDCMVCALLLSVTPERPVSLPEVTRGVLLLPVAVSLLMMALFPRPLIIFDRASDLTSLLVAGCTAAAC
jgi:hypothetical protein